ncbi:YfcZ/YiiS family protein [Sansalvadorimonas sp. 2012CJ34-2]|uniref:YfcZ/YiiS family protein n=1 Tax=Parendozoicomonas callyspongiae TaxID=2942213 RepID=A0ABT0PHX4_9GAMM|nr:DUF406 family protein [Sansalvadorimonas sp. 2012CJ34-2]MCL6270938.1 YfcZ/YiiS family protein [Sansalvadorimonas sp. 2012CJ34-2]
MSDDITCTACNVMDIGTVIREDDCTAIFYLRGDSTDSLKQKLIELARSIENEPCDISEQPVTDEQGEAMQMNFVFSCAAEKLIFDMRAAKLR